MRSTTKLFHILNTHDVFMSKREGDLFIQAMRKDSPEIIDATGKTFSKTIHEVYKKVKKLNHENCNKAIENIVTSFDLKMSALFDKVK